MHEVFISYEHESKNIADNIVHLLESKRIRCWYAPRDVIGDYASSICEAIGTCKIFVLILNERASNSDHCLNEVEMAYLSNLEQQKNIVIMPFRIDSASLNRAMEYYVKRLHWIDASSCDLTEAIEELYQKIAITLGVENKETDSSIILKRHTNKYEVTALEERSRLLTQMKISRQFDLGTYEKCVIGKEKLVVLDVGSHNGSHIIDRLGNREEVAKIIGLEYNAELVTEANNIGCQKAVFYQCDVESSNFGQQLERILADSNVEKVDVINISMVLLHLQNPLSVLKTLRKYLKNGGTIIIKDIDDGLNLAYPDLEGDFAHTVEICQINKEAGYRASGREVYTLLNATGYRDIELENSGLSTVGMNYDERQALFDTYFGFIKDDLQHLSKDNPQEKTLAEASHWITEKYDELETNFLANNFFFNLGFMIFSAKK